MLPACATSDLSSQSAELIVEGNEASYPAFEAAAKACAYTAFWRFAGATVQDTRVPPHFNLLRTHTRVARCAIRWVEEHRGTGLHVTYH
jgi:hypothetical protein